jgi:ABC-type amino acid transport substrate-binding protein
MFTSTPDFERGVIVRGTRTWLVIALIALFVTGLAVAGCGDDDDDGGDTEATTGGGDTASLDLLTEGTLTVGSDIPYPPFEQGNPPDYEGFDIDLINAIAEDLGLEVEIVDAPFDVILAGQAGRFDLAIAATTITDARENRVDFSDPYFESEQSLLVKSDGEIQSIDDITADTVVGAEDGTTGETYANENTDAEVRPFPNIDDAFNALVAGQVEAVINDLPVSAQAVDDKEGLEIVQTFPTDELYGIVFPEGSTLVEPVTEALQATKDDGRLAEIYMEWFDKEPTESVLKATHEPS